MTLLSPRMARAAVWLTIGCATLGGCASRRAPLGDTLENGRGQPGLLGNVVVPLTVRSFDVTTTDNQHAVFLKLSRVPDGVKSREQSSPPRIFIDVAGPAVGDDIPWQTYAGSDTLVNQIEIARTSGQLQIILELNGERLPEYSVRQMADWLMVHLHAAR